MKNQLESLNVSPDVLMQKLMGEPEVMAMMQKPNVMAAVMDLQKDPANLSKYMNDPEVMQFMMKMNELTLQAQMQSQQKTPGSPTPPPDMPTPPSDVTSPPMPPPEPTSATPTQTDSGSGSL